VHARLEKGGNVESVRDDTVFFDAAAAETEAAGRFGRLASAVDGLNCMSLSKYAKNHIF
jgi:hypothetical protein